MVRKPRWRTRDIRSLIYPRYGYPWCTRPSTQALLYLVPSKYLFLSSSRAHSSEITLIRGKQLPRLSTVKYSEVLYVEAQAAELWLNLGDLRAWLHRHKSRCRVTGERWDRFHDMRSGNAKYHYILPFFYKINKRDLPLMHSCVFWCEWNSHNRAKSRLRRWIHPKNRSKISLFYLFRYKKVKYNHIKRSLDYE